jgi:hypothetical protein
MRLFEIHDHPRCPRFLRDMVTDALQILWDFSSLYQPIIPRLQGALARSGTRSVLDLCSGGGGPWLGLATNLEKEEHYPLSVCLTDRNPNRKAFERIQSRSEGTVRFDSRSIDAMRVPTELNGFRTMFSAFHHFTPAEAREVLADAIDHRKGIGIFEISQRTPKTILAVCFIPLVVLWLTPRSLPFRWPRLLWTYLLPVVPFVACFDGWMSCLRSYSQQELSELTRGLPGENYEWEIGEECGGFLPVTYLIAYPISCRHSQVTGFVTSEAHCDAQGPESAGRSGGDQSRDAAGRLGYSAHHELFRARS